MPIPQRFQALVIQEPSAKGTLTQIQSEDLPDYDVLVKVGYSTLNYKDGLALTGNGRIARRSPMIGGIDLVGQIIESRSPQWSPGDQVIVNGWGLSETEWGGFAEYQRLKPEWLVALPEAFTPVQAMAIGTAGYTAMLAVMALEEKEIGPDKGDIIVTGSGGGVGSVAIALLSRLGYPVVAATGRADLHPYLTDLGAVRVIDRAELAQKGAPLQKERWAGGVDSVGSHTLANIIAQTARDGAIAVCGLVGGIDLPTTVFPLILRGVSLLGIDSVMASTEKRRKAWKRLAQDLDPQKLALITNGVYPMSQALDLAQDILAGQTRGRIVIDVSQ